MEPAGDEWQVDATVPSAPRIYDFLLGGKDNFDADRELAARMEAAAGDGASVRELARVNRAFVLKAARWVASMLAVDQFLDLGCGLPLQPAVHDAARDGCPEATVVYADMDAMVLSHVSALQSGPGLAAAEADASDPEAALEAAAAAGLLDLGRPACVILGATLSTMDSAAARAAVAGYAAALAPGSAIIISCASWADPETGRRIAKMSAVAGPWFNHPAGDVASFFAAADLRIIHGRVMDVACWPACPVNPPDQAGAVVLGGIGVVR